MHVWLSAVTRQMKPECTQRVQSFRPVQHSKQLISHAHTFIIVFIENLLHSICFTSWLLWHTHSLSLSLSHTRTQTDTNTLTRRAPKTEENTTTANKIHKCSSITIQNEIDYALVIGLIRKIYIFYKVCTSCGQKWKCYKRSECTLGSAFVVKLFAVHHKQAAANIA